MRRGLRIAGLLVTGLWLTPPAVADGPSALWFRPAIDARGFFEVESASGLVQGDWMAGVLMRWDDDPYTLRLPSRDERLPQIERDVALHALVSVAPFDWLEIGAELPLSLDRAGAVVGRPDFEPSGPALGDLRAALKLAPLREELVGISLGLMIEAAFPTGAAEALYTTDGLDVAGSLILSRRHPFGDDDALFWALQLGYRHRDEAELLGVTFGSELFAGLGVGLHLGAPDLEILGEIAGRTTADDPYGDKARSPLELRGGLRWRPIPQLALTLGAGTGLNGGYGATDIRVLGGVALLSRGERDAPVGVRDRDHDGVNDDDDRCPDAAEDADQFEDADGCPDPDNDGDGLADGDDSCPDEAEDRDGHDDGDGCPEADPDTDGDGIPDHRDRCPDVGEDFDGDADSDGCPDSVDRDGDGIPDGSDRCPNDPEDLDGEADSDGCPDVDEHDRDGDGVPDREGRSEIAAVGTTIYFGVGASRLTDAAVRQLREVAGGLKAHPEITRIAVDGHADERGSHSSNERLARRRAQAARSLLVRLGVARGRIVLRAYGEKRPAVRRSDAAAWSENRRVEIRVIERR